MTTKFKDLLFIPILICSHGCDFRQYDEREKELFEKVKIGMTKKDVVTLLGTPDTVTINHLPEKSHYFYYFTTTKSGLGSELPVVIFDSSNKVKYAIFGD